MMELIFKKAYENIIEDTGLIKLTFFSLLPYSIVFVMYLFYQAFVLISIQTGVNWNELKLYISNVFSVGEFTIVALILIIVFLAIFYFFFPPIAESALILYLDGNKNISSAFGKGILKFFPMFEFHSIISIFSFLYFFILASRLYVFKMITSVFIYPLLIFWFIMIIVVNFFSVYAKFLIVLENQSPFEAFRNSFRLVMLNFSITLKGFLMYLVFYIRFLINILILIGIPLFVIYLFLKSNISNTTIVKYTIYILVFVLFLLTAYINSIVEAFFINVWYEIYKKIEK